MEHLREWFDAVREYAAANKGILILCAVGVVLIIGFVWCRSCSCRR